VDTPGRLRGLLACLLGCLVVHTGLALLSFHGLVDVPAMRPVFEHDVDKETGEDHRFARMSGVGTFGNPNDLSRIIVVGVAVCFYLMGELPRACAPGLLGLVGLFVHALLQTYSRGGLISFIATGLVLLQARFGGWRSGLLGAAGVALLFAAGGGSRQADLGTDEGTAQQRIQLWLEGFDALRESPLFGIGVDQYRELTGGLGAHNGYVHACVEVGLLGGVCFLSASVLAVWGTWRLGRARAPGLPPELARVRPFVLAIVAGYAAGMLSSARTYVTPTYMMLGLAAAYHELAARSAPRLALRLSLRMAVRLAGVSMLALVALYAFARMSVQWN
jgi:O-antigen ligase